MSEATPPAADASPPLDECDMEPRTPMKRLGSTRKLAAFNNIRLQLAEQTRVLEARAEATAGVAGELHEYCRRRAELEHEYARALDKLARAALAKHKDQRHRREQWPLVGAAACWHAALDATRALARDHAALGALYGGALAARLQRAADDALRLHRKCRDVLLERHEEVAAALAAAAHHGKAHAAAHAHWRQAALKLRAALDARNHPPKHKKIKALDKDLEKRRARHSTARAAALRARAEYVLSLEAANATLQRYYLDDVADVILCTEVGFEAVVGRAVRCAGAAEEACGAAAVCAGSALRGAAGALDALADRQRVLDAHGAAFALPRPLPAPPPDEVAAVDALLGEAGAAEGAAEAAARADLATRLRRMDAAARALRAECRENAKTLDAAEAELLKQMEGSDEQWDVSGLFGAGASGAALAPPPPPADDQEDYYLAKFRAYVSCAGRLARVESKAAALRGRLAPPGAAAPPAPPAPPVPRRAGAARHGRPGRFAAPLELRLPRVLTSCVRVIAAHGLRHQGVFRVSGSQVEMHALRAAFERGEDPLAEAGARGAADVNTVCGLLKLYLREVRPPLLPPQLQERLVRVAALPDDAAFAARLRATLHALPLPAVLVLRYLFAFLAHLAEHAQYNMMDAWNLAVCVGPTLLAAWGDPPHQLAAQNLVNELVKRTILLHEQVFPQDVAPHALYRRAGEAAAPAEADADADAEDAAGAESGAALDDLDAAEARARLSPPPVDSDTDEETSDECDPVDWERDSAECHRSGAEPPPQAAGGEHARPRARPAGAPREPRRGAARQPRRGAARQPRRGAARHAPRGAPRPRRGHVRAQPRHPQETAAPQPRAVGGRRRRQPRAGAQHGARGRQVRRAHPHRRLAEAGAGGQAGGAAPPAAARRRRAAAAAAAGPARRVTRGRVAPRPRII